MMVLGVRIDDYVPAEIREKIRYFLSCPGQYRVVTPNPEMIVAAHADHYFTEVLNDADLSVCDGKGIEYLTRKKGIRYAGVDLMHDICALAEREQKTIFLLGSGSNEVVGQAIHVLQKQFPLLRIVGGHQGILITEQALEGYARRGLVLNTDENDAMIDTIIEAKPDILFVAFGHSKQEKWIYEYLDQLPSVRLAMGVGGAFDFIAGTALRAPGWMRQLGVEWLWRLLFQPKRIKRIWRAVVVFPFLYIVNKTAE